MVIGFILIATGCTFRGLHKPPHFKYSLVHEGRLCDLTNISPCTLAHGVAMLQF